MDSKSTLYFLISVIVCFISLCLITLFNRKNNILFRGLEDSADKSKYNPTVLIIYDNSTDKTCDRLINIQPFNWWVWACNNELYVLNPEGGIQCPNNSSPAVRILDNQYIETCMNVNFDAILTIYKKYKPHIINYTIPTNTQTFTILSALNLLVKKYVTFDVTNNSNRRNLIYIDNENSANDVDGNRKHYNHINGRPVDSTTFTYYTSPTSISKSYSHNHLLEQYKKHTHSDLKSNNLHNDIVHIPDRLWQRLQ